ncbi:MAG: nuclear transport factor 2 family protein [Solirubrobacterales bacterium]
MDDQIEITRRLLAAWGTEDWPWELMAEDFVLEQHGGTMAGVYPGRDGIEQYAGEFADAWDRHETAVDEITERDDAIVALTTLEVHGRLSGIDIEIRGAGIVRFDAAGKVARLDVYTDRDEGLAAASSP